MQLCANVGYIFNYYKVDSGAEAAASVAVGRSRRENDLEQQLEHAHALVTYVMKVSVFVCTLFQMSCTHGSS